MTVGGDEMGEARLAPAAGPCRRRPSARFRRRGRRGWQHHVAQPQRGRAWRSCRDGRRAPNDQGAQRREANRHSPHSPSKSSSAIHPSCRSARNQGASRRYRAERTVPGGRKMMPRRHDREACPGVSAVIALSSPALRIDRHRHAAHAGERQRLAGADRSRFLDPVPASPGSSTRRASSDGLCRTPVVHDDRLRCRRNRAPRRDRPRLQRASPA